MAVARQCPECGKQYISKARFCRDDGAKLVDSPSQPDGVAPSEPKAKTAATKAEPRPSARDGKSKPGIKEAKGEAKGKDRLDGPTPPPIPLPGTDPRPSLRERRDAK